MNPNSRFDSEYLIRNRHVRIFLSSTFSDMQEERSALVKTFEMLKIKANQRNVIFSVVDLRWGVTEEEARTGKVLSICLNEIEHSHPFFIGLLGNRYGTSPALSELEKNPELKERYPWIEQDIEKGLSITEMEMQYGVLRNKAEIDAAFFIKNVNHADDNPRLTSLKNKIREQNIYPVENYCTIEELCKKVEFAISQIIDNHFPEMDITAQNSERIIQQAYINSRHTSYIHRQFYYDIIDSFVCSDDSYLVLTGESGIGKSALLANWIKKNLDNDDFNLIYYFVSNTFTESNYEIIFRYLCDEISYLYCIEDSENMQGTIEGEVQRLINIVASREQPLVIIIDGINQIVTMNSEKTPIWIPVANNKVKFIFSTLQNDDTLRNIKNFGCRLETLLPLNIEERKHFVEVYLYNVGKRLDNHQIQRIVEDPENTNTLVLKTLLDELICFETHEKLNDRLDYYLSTSSMSDFFDRVLQRMEEDYSANQDLVRHILTLIAISEHGLSEDELLSVLGCRQLDWQLFYGAFFNHFIMKNGLLTFSQQFITEAVENRFNTKDVDYVAPYRREIVNFFCEEPQSVRKVSELSCQYFNLSDWDNLYCVLKDIETFEYFFGANQALMGLYWRTLMIIDRNKFSLSTYINEPFTYEDELDCASIYDNIATFIGDYFPDLSLELEYLFKALDVRKKNLGGDHLDTAISYNNIGLAYSKHGDFSNALNYYLKALVIREKVLGKWHSRTATTYDNIGCAYYYLNDQPRAFEFICNALKIRQKVLDADHSDIALSYNNLGLVLDAMGDSHNSLQCHFKALQIMEKTLGTGHPFTANSYNNIGNAFDNQGDHKRALGYFFKGLEIRKMILGEEHPATGESYNNIGMVYYKQENYSQALGYYLKALEIEKNTPGRLHPNIANYYGNIGMVYECQGMHPEALKCYFKALEYSEKIFGKENKSAAFIYKAIGRSYNNQNNNKMAIQYSEIALRIMKRTLGPNHPETVLMQNDLKQIKKNR